MSPLLEPNPAIAIRRMHEEVANSATHALGLGLSVAGLAALLMHTSVWSDPWRLAGCLVYGLTLVALYAGSTLYHSLQDEDRKQFFCIVDHICIYLLIAGTYTPFTLTWLRPTSGWLLFLAVWGLALAGVAFKLRFGPQYATLSTTIYVAMGWVALLAGKSMFVELPGGALAWLLAGGASYTIGVYFFCRHQVPFSHAVWHLFVLAGSLCHYAAIVFYVAQAPQAL